MDEKSFREYLEKISTLRGVKSQFDRFKADWIENDGVKLHLRVIETKRGAPTIVFVPGTSAYALLYHDFLVAMADRGMNVVGLDPRGHGFSDGAKGSFTIPELVSDTRAAVKYAREKFGDPIFVVGSSQGGITAFYLAATDEKVAGCVCHNAADLSDPSSVKLTRTPTLSRIMLPGLKFFASIMPELSIPISMYLDLTKEEMKGFGNAKDFLDQDPIAYRSIKLKGLASLASEKLERPVEQITTPVMILHSGRDNIFPTDYIEAIYKRLTCVKEWKVYPDLPHLILTEHVDLVAPDVVAWIKKMAA